MHATKQCRVEYRFPQCVETIHEARSPAFASSCNRHHETFGMDKAGKATLCNSHIAKPRIDEGCW